MTASGLSLVTLTSLISLAPLTLAILGACCGGDWEPVLALFLIVWLLLIPLWVWQFLIALSAWRLRT
jgi:hypothetical protein